MTRPHATESRLLNEVHAFLGAPTHTPPVPSWGPCLRLACSAARLFTRASGPLARPLVALGRLRNNRRSEHDHAWLILPSRGGSLILDPLWPGHGWNYLPLVLIDTSCAWSAIDACAIDSLRPSFFLSIHCQINDKALAKAVAESDLDDINRATARVDDPFVHPNYDPREHFDNTLVVESIELLEDRLGWRGETRLHTVAPDARQAVAYGLAVHAIADFYSHSNFVPMAVSCFGSKPDAVPTIDEAVADGGFEEFIENTWMNSAMWRDQEGYASVEPFQFDPALRKCLITGGYGGDGWPVRADIPHHDVFAVDQPASALTDAPRIQRRRHPFAFPGLWKEQFGLRRTLAIRHIRNAFERARAGDPTPFLGTGRSLPVVLRPPVWMAEGQPVAVARALPDRAASGWLTG